MFWIIGLSLVFAEEEINKASSETLSTDSTEQIEQTEEVEQTPKSAQQSMIDHSIVLSEIENNNAKGALKASRILRKGLSCPQRIPLTKDLAILWVHRGYAEQLLGKDERVQFAWEQAFTIDPDIQMDPEILKDLPELEQENLLNHFEQVRRLVEGQGVFDPNIPKNLGEVKIFVNGRSLSSGQGLKAGEHLAQIVCPNDGLQSKWTTFGKPLEWFSMCPSGVEISDTPVEEDFFGAGLFGGSQEDTAEYYNPEPICDSGRSIFFSSMSMSSFNLPEVDSTVLLTMGSGVGLVLAGTGTYYAWVVPAFDNVLDARGRVETQSITISEADNISKTFNMARYTTLGLLATGTVLTGYGTVLTVQSVSVQPTWTPSWIGINGQF
jgi:hypothetical protein